MQNLLKSKRFWVAAGALAGIAAKILFGDAIPVTEEQITNAVVIIASWVVGDSLRATNPTKQ